jgi:iron-sulfur cluster assembly accessory protein
MVGALVWGMQIITLTPKAAEELGKILKNRASSAGVGLRLAVRRGGCAGWQYEMQVAEPAYDDVLVEFGGARVLIAVDSVEKLQGCEIDFSDDLTDAGFKINNPSAVRSCGCGTSFQTSNEADTAPAVLDGEACGSH